MKQLKYIICLVLFIGVYVKNAQNQVVSFVKYGVENGLVQSQVQSIAQDNDGRLWIGTISGVSIYDGVSYKNITTRDSLAENYVTNIYKTSNGDIWMGHWAGSISRFDYTTREIEDVKIERFNQFQSITDFVEDTATNFLLFSSNGSGVFVYDIENDKVFKLNYSENPEARYVTTLHIDKRRKVWVGTENSGIFIFDIKDIKAEKIVSYHLTDENGLPSNQIRDIEDYKNDLWIATTGSGLVKITSDNAIKIAKGEVNKLNLRTITEADGLPSEKVTDLLEDHRGELWVGTRDKGVIRLTFDQGKYEFSSYSTKEGLSFYDINCLFIDRENTVWIGTNVGLNQYISDYFLLYDKSLGLSNNIIWSVCPDLEGNIWLGTNTGVSKLINATGKTDKSVQVQEFIVEGIDKKAVRVIFRDSKANLWFATGEGKLFKRTKAGAFEKVNIESVLKDLILSIEEDNNGNIWLGTRAGVARLNPNTLALDFFGETEGLGGSNVSKIVKDKNGVLWFACSSGNLTSYDGTGFKVYTEKDGIKPFILCATIDNQGILYFGAYTGGMYKYDGTTFTNYTTDNGLRSESPYALIADDENNIWIGTSYGVEKFEPATETFSHYGNSEGFLGLEVNNNSIAIDENQNIWFGTILGTVKYNPSADYGNDVKPVTLIPGIQIGLEDAAFPFNNTFGALENDITFKYIGVSLNNSNKVRYQYFLEGYDKDWSKKTDMRQAFYSNLDPGKYSFKVKAINSYGVESDVANYSFNIEQPFYMSNTFYGIQVALIIIMLTAAVFYGRKTGGSRIATILASIAVIITFEYGINYVEDNLEEYIGEVAFIKVGLNVLLGLMLFPVEQFVKRFVVKKDPVIESSGN